MRRWTRIWSRFGGPLLTVAAVAVIELLSETVRRIADPHAVLLLATVYSTFNGGLRQGLISAGITAVYLAYFFSVPGQFFRYGAEELQRVLVWAIAAPAMVLMVGLMKRRADRASDEIVRRERDHSVSLEGSLAERQRAEQALRASEERYRLLFERNLAGIFRSQRDGRMLECNTALVHILGFASRDELLAHNAAGFYADPGDRERLLKLLQPGVVVSNHEVRWRRADGRLIWVLVNVREVVEGSSTYLEGIVIDITDRKRGESATLI
jgi:PAS domain S-box-containing protein